MTPPIVGLSSILPPDVERFLRASGDGVQLRAFSATSEEELIDAVCDVDALAIGTRERMTARVIASLGRCRVIARCGVGVDNVDVRAATEHGVLVTCVPDAAVEEVSDHAVAMLLSFARRMEPLNRAVHEGRWAREGGGLLARVRAGTHRLSCQTLGLVGFGRIGRATWRKARAFGMTGLVYDPFVGEEVVRAEGAEPVGLDDLVARSDFVSLHAPLAHDTKQLFDRDTLARMKPTAFLINTARGTLVDEAALVEALDCGRLAGAALDVTIVEPVPEASPLVGLSQVLLTGHSGYYSEESAEDVSRRTAECVLVALRGGVPEGLVNPEALGRLRERWS